MLIPTLPWSTRRWRPCDPVFTAWRRYTSLTNFIIQQSRSFEGVCVPLRLTNCLFPVPDSQPTATELFSSPRCTDLEQSSAAYHICSVTSRLLLSPEDILLRTVIVVPAKWLSFMDTLLTYLLIYEDLSSHNTGLWQTDRQTCRMYSWARQIECNFLPHTVGWWANEIR